MRSVTANVLLLLISLIVALIVAEASLEFKARWSDKSRVLEVENFEFNYAASMNRDGFRGNEIRREKKRGVTRVIVIGDSFIYGVGMAADETIPARMSQLLREVTPTAVEVLNLGDSGASTREYLQIAKRYRRHAPDIVFLALYVDNDVTSYGRERHRWIVNRHLYKLAATARRRISRSEGDCIFSYVDVYDIDPFLKEQACKGTMNPGLLRRGEVGDNELYYDRLTERFLADSHTRSNILKIRGVFPDAVFRLVLLPSKYQANASYLEEMAKIGFTDTGKAVSGRLQNTIREWADAQTIETLDILPAIREAEQQGIRCYFEIDDHFSREGAAVTARILAAEVAAVVRGNDR